MFIFFTFYSFKRKKSGGKELRLFGVLYVFPRLEDPERKTDLKLFAYIVFFYCLNMSALVAGQKLLLKWKQESTVILWAQSKVLSWQKSFIKNTPCVMASRKLRFTPSIRIKPDLC